MFSLFVTGLICSGFGYAGNALTALLLIGVVVIGYQQAWVHGVWRNYPLSPLMIIYLIWLAVVALTSSLPTIGLMNAAALAGLPIGYLFFSNTSQLSTAWPKIRVLLLILGVLFAGWAIQQVYQHVGIGQAMGPLRDRNAFESLMNVLWFPAAFLFLRQLTTPARGLQLAFGLGLLTINVALFATTSRGGNGAWLLLLPIFLWAGYRQVNIRKKIGWIALIAIVAYLISALVLHNTIADRTFDLSQDVATSARLYLWQSTLHMAMTHPWLGTGWGSFAAYYPVFRSPLETGSAGNFAHNDYLQFAAEGGFFAGFLLLAVAVGVTVRLKKTFKYANTLAGFESISLLLATLALFVHATVNFIFYYAFMNILIGLYLAHAAQLTETPRYISLASVKKISPSLRRVAAGTLLFITAAPYLIHLFAMACFAPSQLGIKVIQWVAPTFNINAAGNFISSVMPTDPYAENFTLQADKATLAELSQGKDQFLPLQLLALNKTLYDFNYLRAHDANNPIIGVTEARILLQYHNLLPSHIAYEQAQNILHQNLVANPQDAESMIMLARVQTAEGLHVEAYQTLQYAMHHVPLKIDQQLVIIEALREYAAPNTVPELDTLEQQLNILRHDVWQQSPDSLNTSNETLKHISQQLTHITQQLTHAH